MALPETIHAIVAKIPPPLLRIVKFATVGGSGTVLYVGLSTILNRSGLFSPIPVSNSVLTAIGYPDGFVLSTLLQAGIISIELAILNNFLWHTLWTWADRPADSHGHHFRRLLKYNITAGTTAYGLNIPITMFLNGVLGLPDFVATTSATACVSIINFLLSHFWAFRHRSPSAVTPSGD